MNNLVGKPEYAELQARLDAELTKKLEAIGDELRPKEFYLEKWSFVLDEKKVAVDFWSFNNGKGVVKTPEKQN